MQNRNRLTNIEYKLVVTKGARDVGGSGKGQITGTGLTDTSYYI